MEINGFSLLFGLFTLVMIGYLYFVQKSILIPVAQKRMTRYVVLLVSCLILVGVFYLPNGVTTDEMARGFFTVLVVLSFLLNTKGLAADRIYIRTFDNQGIFYGDIERVVLLQKGNKVRMNYFKNGRRGPLLVFAASLEELVIFLSDKLNEETELTILFEEEEP